MYTREEIKEKLENIKGTRDRNNLYKLEFDWDMYADSKSKLETLCRYAYNIDIRPTCPICGNEVEFIHKNGKLFRKYCSNKCKIKDTNMIERHKQGCLIKYGVDNISKVQEIKDKKEKTFLKHFGTKNNFGRKEVSQTIKDLYGVDNISKLEDIKLKKQKTCLNNFGVKSGLQLSYARELRKSKESIEREYETKRKNHTLGINISSNEILIFNELLKYFPNTIQQYISPKYHYKCDFYIPELDLYIEYNGFWTHGNKPYEGTKEDNELIKKWESKGTDFYKSAIITWAYSDVKKRNIAKQNNINYLEVWDEINKNNIKDFINFIINNYSYNYAIPFNISIIRNEYKYYCFNKGNLNKTYINSKIIKYFQQDTFYIKEKEILNNEKTRNKIIENRKKYLNKDNFTIEELFDGIKLSHIYYGYSHFNPLWFKWFIEQYNCKKCYDPCGGWGHRLLGANELELYIYNDLSTTTYNNVNRIIDYFNISNTITYNNDANSFIPKEEFDSMFTCPPYYNLEHYECGDFESIEQYNEFIDNIFSVFYHSKAKVFGLVIREDLLSKKYNYIEKIDISPSKANHMHKTNNKKYKEYMYIFYK